MSRLAMIIRQVVFAMMALVAAALSSPAANATIYQSACRTACASMSRNGPR